MKKIGKKGAMGAGMVILTTLVIIGLVGGLVWFFGGFGQLTLGGDERQSCGVDTKLTYSTVNALKKGTAVTPDAYVIKVNDGSSRTYASSDIFSPGDRVETLANATNFLDVIVSETTLKCGSNQIDAEMFATSTNSFRFFSTNNQLLGDSAVGGGTNQSSSANPINIEVKIDSTVDESSGDLIIVIESNDTEIDDITISGLGGASKVSVPDVHSEEFTTGDSILRAYRVPAILDGVTMTGTLTLTPESSQTIGAGTTPVYVTAYSEQGFQDTDGSFSVGIEDADGTATYEDTWDGDFTIV